MYDGSTTLHQMSTQKSCRMSTRQLEAPRAQRELLMTSPKPRHERLKQRPNQGVVQRLKAPDHLRQRLRQQVPQATQASSSSAAAGPAKAKPAPKQMPTSAKSSRPSPTDKPQTSTSVQEETHWLIWHIFFSSELVTLSERPVLMMPGHYVVYSIFIDEHHKDWLVRGLWARPSTGLA